MAIISVFNYDGAASHAAIAAMFGQQQWQALTPPGMPTAGAGACCPTRAGTSAVPEPADTATYGMSNDCCNANDRQILRLATSK